MKLDGKSTFIIIIVILLLLGMIGSCEDDKKNDEWHTITGEEIVCRRNGCGRKPVYSDWNRRYCSTHIKETHSCRYPGCSVQIPNSSSSQYCSQHD